MSDPRAGCLHDQELLSRLIAFESVSANSNLPVADFVANYAAAAGCRVWRQTYSDRKKANLLLQRGPQSAQGLMLSGHLDVVPANEPGWESDPFRLSVRDERLFGRGAADMLAFVAQALNLLCETPEGSLTAPLMLLLTADEEVGSIGAQEFKRAQPEFEIPTQVLVGEPTSLRAVRMHKGHMRMRAQVAGKPAHSGYPHLGQNAIERSIPLLEALRDVASGWRQERMPSSAQFPECPFPVLNLALIAGGSAVNIVPAACQIDFGIRLLPGQESGWALRGVEGVQQSLPAETRSATTIELMNDSPPMLCRPDAPLYEFLCATQRQTEAFGVSYASDAGTLQKLGMDCVLFGAGTIEDAHKANESVSLVEWQAARRVLASAVRHFCQAGNP